MKNTHFATLKRFINFRIYWIMHDALKFSNLLPLSFHHFHFKDIFSHENGNHKIEYTISTWHTELESSCRSCVRLKPLQFETTHFFENGWWYCEIIEWTNNHIFIFILQPRNDPMYDTRSRWHNVMPSMTQVCFSWIMLLFF